MSVALKEIGYNSDRDSSHLIADGTVLFPCLDAVIYPRIIPGSSYIAHSNVLDMHDPNFPANLDIRPLHLQPAANSSVSTEDIWKQREAIKQYGIAGRIWCVPLHLVLANLTIREASHALLEYFTPSSTIFSPPCSIFASETTNTIVELGSGQSVASLHLAESLDMGDTLVLTDLPNVVPLMDQSIETWKQSHAEAVLPVAEPLGWGTDIKHLKKYGQISHVICCDLVSLFGIGINAIIGSKF